MKKDGASKKSRNDSFIIFDFLKKHKAKNICERLKFNKVNCCNDIEQYFIRLAILTNPVININYFLSLYKQGGKLIY